MNVFTNQETLFIDRIGEYLQGADINSETLIKAALRVNADDNRLVGKILDNAEFKKAAVRYLSNKVYEQFKNAALRHFI